jgi:putative restriction endonuclease
MPATVVLDDARVRLRAFEFLAAQTRLRGEELPRRLLELGFDLDGARVPLVGPQGIFKPAVLPDVPLTITTVPPVSGRPAPYDDAMDEDGVLRYRYRGDDPRHRDNAGLRLAMTRGTPLVYLFGTVPGWYVPVWPVLVVGDDPARRTFTVAADDARQIPALLAVAAGGGSAPPELREIGARRRYVTALVQRRLHQQAFRERVLQAYRERCAICRLRHRELLEAAHILPDRDPRGEPVVANGLALCALHHAAFDRHFLGVRPDLVVDLRPDVLREADGPMLRYGLQGFQGARLHVPRAESLRPNPDFLAERYDLFRGAA